MEVEEVDSAHLMKGTQTFDNKKAEDIKEPLKEKGVSMQNKVGKRGPLLATIAAIVKKSAEKEEAHQLPQVDNSPIMPPTLTIKTMEECS